MTSPINDILGGGLDTIPSVKPDVTKAPSGIVDSILSQPTIQAREPSFWEKFKNLSYNAGLLANKYLISNPDANPFFQNLDKANKDSQMSQAADIAGSQMKDMFTTTKGFGQLVSDVGHEIGQGVKNVVDDPTGVVTSIPSGLLSMATTPVDALLGVNITSDQGDPLSVQERAQRIKDTAALITQTLVTEGAGAGLKAVGLGGKSLDLATGMKATDTELATNAAANVGKVSNYAKTLARGAIAGGAGGIASGFVSGAGNEDQIAKAVSAGIMFAPLGAVANLFLKARPELAETKNTVDLATNIQNWRAINFKFNDTIKDLDLKATSIYTSDNLADAVLNNKVKEGKIAPTIIEGVSSKGLDGVEGKDLNYDVTTRDKGSGLSDVLLTPKDVQVNKSAFRSTGHIEGEVVSHEGRNYILSQIVNKDLATLTTEGGERKTIPMDQVRRVNNGLVLDPQVLLDREYEALKNKIAPRGLSVGSADPNAVAQEFQNLDLKRQQYFARRLQDDAMRTMDERTQKLLQNFYVENTAPKSVGSIEEFINHAQTNGYGVDISDAGQVILRDLNDKQQRVVGQGKNLAEARKLINKSGQVPGSELVSTVGLQGTNPSLGEPPNVNRPEAIPFLQSPVKWASGKMDLYNDVWKKLNNVVDYTGHWTTPANDLFKAIDNRFGTRFHSQLFDGTQVGKQAALSASDEYVKIASKLTRQANNTGLRLNDLHNVMNYLEAASPETIIKDGFSREMNPQEINAAKALNNNEAISKAFKVRNFIRGKVTPEDIEAYKHTIGYDAESQKASDLLDVISKMDPNQMHEGYIVRLARAMNDKATGVGGLDRAEYAKENNMDGRHISIANQIEETTKKLAPIFGVDPKDIMNFWMTHARLYSAGDMTDALNLFARDADPKAKEFYGKLARTGEIDAYERNPIVALYRYITAGFNSLHFDASEAVAKNYLSEVLSSNLIPDAEKVKVQTVAESYLNDLRGRTPLMSAATESAVNSLYEKTGTDISVRKKLVGFMKTVQVGTQGFKIGAGIRDLMNATGFIFYRYGPEKLENVLRRGLDAHLDGDKLIKEGKLIGLSLDRLADPTSSENALSNIKTVAGDAWDRFSNASLKYSGQENVYNMVRQGMYHDTYSIFANAARELVGGKIERAEFYKKIGLEKDFSDGVVAEVKRQIEQTSPVRYDQVAEYLSREAARQVTPSYGLGNNPTGWSRNVGRLAGQYGSYSMWALRALKEPLTTGSYGDRAARLARFGLWTSAILGANNTTGYNFSPWYIHRTDFSGGPLAQLGLNMYNAAASSGTGYNPYADQVMKLSPIKADGTLNLKQFYIPGSFAISDIMQSIGEGNPLPILGVKPQP